MSLLVQECGLKQDNRTSIYNGNRSLLVQECGLKLRRKQYVKIQTKSLLVQECGLKQAMDKVSNYEASHSLYRSVD